jgi:hypothetical protein
MHNKMQFRTQFLNGVRWYVVYLSNGIMVFPTRKGPNGYVGIHANISTDHIKCYPRVAGR